MHNEQRLNEIFLQLFSYSFPQDYKETSFFEEPIRMRARYYIMLLLEIERLFDIRFPDVLIGEMKLITYQALLHEINNLTVCTTSNL